MSESNGVGQDVVRRVEDDVLWIVINRPDAGNALTSAMRSTIADWLDAASADLNVRAVVLTASGDRAFCTGADLRRGAPPSAPRPAGAPDSAVGDNARTIRTGWQRLIGSVLDCEKPVVAGVNGTAAGGGMHLALACDLVVASTEARFIEVFVRRGIAPDAGGAWLLARLIGIQKAKELFFFGDDLTAGDAHRLGLVNQVVAAAEVEPTVRALSGRLATGPTKAIGVAKWLTNRALDVDRMTAFHDEALAQELITGTEDSREGIDSFVDRRPARFKGW